MKVDNHLLAVFKAMVSDRYMWQYVTDQQKADFFFIINRYMSKKEHRIAQMLNRKGIDPVLGMDLLFNYFDKKPYPGWFWSKSDKKPSNGPSKAEKAIVMKHYEISEREIADMERLEPGCVKKEAAKILKNQTPSTP